VSSLLRVVIDTNHMMSAILSMYAPSRLNVWRSIVASVL